MDTLVAMTYPEIRDFFDRYVWDSQHLPIKEYYAKLGIRLIEGRDGTPVRFEIDPQPDPGSARAPGGVAGPEAQTGQLSDRRTRHFWVYAIGNLSRPRRHHRCSPAISLSPSFSRLPLGAAPLAAQSAVPVSTCESDALCGQVPRPIGLYVRAVEEDGRYLALEDGSYWEVEISDRATTASWAADDFVNLSWIAAPRGDFEYQLSRAGDLEQHAAARLAGRRPGPSGQE